MGKNKVYIGTSGWHYKHWMGTFYPVGTKAKEQLAYFTQHFKTVELNNSFYMLPKAETFRAWRAAVPDEFIFAVKLNRYITHLKRLEDTQQQVEQFLDHASELAEKLGPILVQLPPGWKIDLDRLAAFLEMLPKGYRYTFEFRNRTWYTEEVLALLREHGCAFCIYQLAGHMSPIEVTADFVYVRLHGPLRMKYAGSYTEAALQEWAGRIRGWVAERRDVYIYFDNDQLGYAAFNAKRLAEILEMRSA